MNGPLRVVELFAGIGAQASALERLGIDFTSTVCEIDPHAYNAYCAIHGPTPNLGDITKVEHLPECDLITYSFPCQDLSVAGNQKGMAEGSETRSALLWEVERLLRDMRERLLTRGVADGERRCDTSQGELSALSEIHNPPERAWIHFIVRSA